MKTTTWFQMLIMAWQYMRGRKLRTALTTLAVVFGVALIFAFNLVLPSALKAIRESIDSEAGAVDLTIASVSGETFLPAPPLQTVSEIDGVKNVAGILQRKIILPDDFELPYSEITLLGVDPVLSQDMNHFELSKGNFLRPEGRGEVIVPKGVAEVGDTIPLLTAAGTQNFGVVGVLADEAEVAPRFIVSLADAQQIVNQADLINIIQVNYADGANAEEVQARIEAALGEQFVTNPKSEAFATMELALVMLNVFGMIALFLGGFLIFNTFRTVIIERRHDLGMLRAIGATRRQIMQLILIESLLQGLLGTLMGLVVGYGLALLMTDFMMDIWEQFVSSINLTLEFNLAAFSFAIFMGLGVTLLAGYLPARHASHISPLEALRPTPISAANRAARWGLYLGLGLIGVSILLLVVDNATAPLGAVVFLVGIAIAAPALVVPAARLFEPFLTLWFAREGDIARSNLVRQPGRASITASTLMIGLATLVLMVAIVSGFGAMIDNMMDTTFSNDILLMPPAVTVYSNLIGADESLKQNIQALPEVEAVSDWRYASSAYNGSLLYVIGIDPLTYPMVTDLEFNKGDADEVFQALGSGRTMIVNSIAATTFGLKVGDHFELQTAEGLQTYTVVGIADDILNFKLTTLTISQDNMAADFHKTESILLMVTLKNGVDKEAALSQIQNLAQDYPQFKVQLTQSYRDEFGGVAKNAMNVYYVLAALILIPAGLGLLNTLTINVLERTREIGVVRAVGASRTQVQRMVLAEALLLGLFGSALGVLGGVAMSYGFTAAFSTVGWEVPYIFPLMGIIAAIVIGILLAMFASVLPAQNAAKLDIIRALQYE